MIARKTPDSATASPESEGMTHWDKVALTKWGAYVVNVERGLVLRGLELAGKPSVGVDVGCGSGRWSSLASEAGWRMTCIDADRQTLSLCQRNLPQANCVLADPGSRAIPCPSNSAALMLCIEVGEVIETDWFPSEASRVLGDKGILVAVAWNRHSWRGLACRLKYFLTGSPHAQHYYNHTYSRWKAKLAADGFEVLYQEGLCWGPVGRASDSFLAPLFVKLERLLRLHRLVAWSPWVAFIARRTAPAKPQL